MNGAEVKAALQESFTLAEALGFQGTPSYVIGNEAVVGAVGRQGIAGQDQQRALRQGDLLRLAGRAGRLPWPPARGPLTGRQLEPGLL